MNRPIKIAFNAIRVTNKAGSGFDTFIINFLNEFAKKCPAKIEYTIYTMYPHHFVGIPKQNIKQVKLPFMKFFSDIRQSETVSNKKNKINIFKKLFLLSLNQCNLFIKKIVNPDWFRMFWTQMFFAFFAKKYDLAVALTEYDASAILKNQIVLIHNTVPFLYKNQKHKYKFYTYRLLPYILKNVRKIITVSNFLKEELVKLFNLEYNEISTIYEGVDKNLFYKASDFQLSNITLPKRFILTVGHSHPIKNFENVIKSYLILKKEANIDLVVIGLMDKRYLEYLKKNIIKDYSLLNSIRFLGHVKNNELKYFYSSAEVFVFATLHEGFGLPPLEAMACGCPVVVSNNGSLPEIVGEAGLYVDPLNPEEISNKIKQILNNENLKNTLIKKGYENIKKYSWENTVSDFLKIVSEIKLY